MDQPDQQRYLPYLEEVIDLLRAGNSYDAVQLRHPELSINDIKSCHEIGMQRLHRESVPQPVYCRLDTRKKSNH